MAMEYFLQHIAYYSSPCITVLLPICSLFVYLAGTITFLYPLTTKLFTVYAHWCQNGLLFMLLAPKPLFQLLYLGLLIENI